MLYKRDPHPGIPPTTATPYDLLYVHACLCVYIYAAYVYVHPCSLSRPTVHTRASSRAVPQHEAPPPVKNGLSSFANPPVLNLSFFHLRPLNYSRACTLPYFPLLLNSFSCVSLYMCVCLRVRLYVLNAHMPALRCVYVYVRRYVCVVNNSSYRVCLQND